MRPPGCDADQIANVSLTQSVRHRGSHIGDPSPLSAPSGCPLSGSELASHLYRSTDATIRRAEHGRRCAQHRHAVDTQTAASQQCSIPGTNKARWQRTVSLQGTEAMNR